MPNWTLNEYRREYAVLMDVKRFDATTVDGENLVSYDRNRYERDMVLKTARRRWAVLSRRCIGTFVNTLFADMPFGRYELELSYYRWMRDVVTANMEVAKNDPGSECWLFDKPYLNMYLMGCRTQRAMALVLETCQ